MRWFLLGFVAILLFSIGLDKARAEPITPPAYGVCKNHIDQPVKYIPAPTWYFKMMFPMTKMGVAILFPVPVVIYDYQTLGEYSAEFQQLVFWHECGHHVLGHWLAGGKGEREADCWAAKEVMKRGFDDAKLITAIEGLRKSGMNYFEQRASVTWSCAMHE